MAKCDECSAAVQICEKCDGAGKKRWSGECSSAAARDTCA